jgi:hypothetical protein
VKCELCSELTPVEELFILDVCTIHTRITKFIWRTRAPCCVRLCCITDTVPSSSATGMLAQVLQDLFEELRGEAGVPERYHHLPAEGVRSSPLCS